MARIKRRRSLHATKLHDRRWHDLSLNAEVAAIEVDDPPALEAGEKIVALRSIRNDPLARLRSHHPIDEAQYRWRPRLAARLRASRARSVGGRPYLRIFRWRLEARAHHRRPAPGGAAAQSGRARCGTTFWSTA